MPILLIATINRDRQQQRLNSTEAPADTDNDGMRDSWETANNLAPGNPADAQLKTVDGIYPNIEVYINSLVSTIVGNQNK